METTICCYFKKSNWNINILPQKSKSIYFLVSQIQHRIFSFHQKGTLSEVSSSSGWAHEPVKWRGGFLPNLAQFCAAARKYSDLHNLSSIWGKEAVSQHFWYVRVILNRFDLKEHHQGELHVFPLMWPTYYLRQGKIPSVKSKWRWLPGETIQSLSFLSVKFPMWYSWNYLNLRSHWDIKYPDCQSGFHLHSFQIRCNWEQT